MSRRKNRQRQKTRKSYGDDPTPVTVKQAMIKALVLGGSVESEIEASQIIEERSNEWGGVGAVDPVLDLESLLFLHEISDTLRQCVDAYVCNIELNGHVLKPKIDLTKKEEAEKKVREVIEAELFANELDIAYEEGKNPSEIEVGEPSEQEVTERAKKLAAQVRREMHVAKAWFRNCSPKNNWDWLRSKKRVDEEVVGHGAFEVLRDSNGRVRRLEHIPAHTVLPMTDDGKRVNVKRLEWISDVSTVEVTEQIMFRKFVQKESGKTVYFKEFGDPRAMDRDTGKLYEAKFKKNQDGEYEEVMSAEEVMRRELKVEVEPANELFYFPVESPHTPAGMIRWCGWIVSIFGNRAAAESNLAYFENHAVPSSALLIGGGTLADKSVSAIKGHLTKKHKGARNHNRLLILQATAGEGRPNEKVENPEMKWINLSEHQKGDATFSKYTTQNQDGLTSSFRQSPILTGRIPSDLNRATAWAVLFQADRQVYGPLRRSFDVWVNTVLLPAIGCFAIEFESLSPVGTDIETMSKALDIGIKGGAFSPNEIRMLFSLWLNEPFDEINEEWARVPFAMTLNQINTDGTSNLTPETQEEAVEEYKRVVSRIGELQGQIEDEIGIKDGMIEDGGTGNLATLGG